MYVGSGSSNLKESDGQNSRFFHYNVDSNNWSELAPSPVYFYSLVAFDNRPLALGGITEKKQNTSDLVHMFNDGSSVWERAEIPSMNIARHSFTAFSYESNIVACGGKNQQGISNSVEVFKSGSEEWIESSNLPFPAVNMTSTIINGIVYLLGGFSKHNRAEKLTDLIVFAQISSIIETNNKLDIHVWKTLQNTSIQHPCSTIASICGCLVGIGGPKKNAKVYFYSDISGKWDVLSTNLPYSDYCFPAVASLPDGKILVIGADSRSNPYSHVLKFFVQ